VRFLSIDQHISVIADIKAILRAMGHTVDDLCLSAHAHIMGREQDRARIPELAGDLWQKISDENRWHEVASAHAEEWKRYDGFITTHPPLFARLFVDFEKSVVSVMTIRVDSGVHDKPDLLNALLDDLRKPNVILCANNKVDAMYGLALLRKPVVHIPSLCAYTAARYDPRDTRVLSYEHIPAPELDRSVFVEKSVLGKDYKWQDVANFRAVLHLPYQVSSMSIFEQYTAGIPILVPDIDLMMRLWYEGRVLNHLSNASLWGTAPQCAVAYDEEIAHHDPNDYRNADAVRWWARLADYYDTEWMPDIVQFESFDDLHRLAAGDFGNVSETMRVTNIERRQRVYGLWEGIMRKVKDML